ncbi:probable serine/threonine-protein kinase DDB_G0267686 [Drosophila erecta]|nr:probable serine/threonine-protein kinase DDB_G0267686 [Drosophila erecta]
MANPKSSGGNKSKGNRHQHRQSQQNSQQQHQSQQSQQTQLDPSQLSQLTPTPVAATGLEPATATPLNSHPSEDTLALAAAVAASIPAAPLARPIPDRRSTTPAVVTPTSNSLPETCDAAENLATSRTTSAAPAASENRRGIFQRLFGWSS